jgi:hypothetical protein
MALGIKTGGRQLGTPNKATAEVRSRAQDYAPDALKELHRLSQEAESETARVSACNAILERAYGKAQTSTPIVIDLPEIETAQDVSRAVAAVILTTAEGKISPAEASTLCGILETQRRAIEASDLEARISALEGKPS